MQKITKHDNGIGMVVVGVRFGVNDTGGRGSVEMRRRYKNEDHPHPLPLTLR